MKTQTQQFTLSRRSILATFATLVATSASAGISNIALPTLTVAVKDTVRGATENIDFSGNVTIGAKLIDDPDLRAPRVVELIIDFAGLTGVGMSSGQTYRSQAQSVLHRPLLVADQIRTSFPFYPANNIMAARTAVATFFVSFVSSRVAITSKLTTP